MMGVVVFAFRDEKYMWTQHARMKARFYRLTESRIKRIIRHPSRIEEGIFVGAVACMQPAGGRVYSEIWALYVLAHVAEKDEKRKLKIITAWRYPGKSPERDPIPSEILKEIKNIVC